MSLRARLLDAVSAPSCAKSGVTGVTGVTSVSVTPQVTPENGGFTPVTPVTCEKTLLPKECVTKPVTANSVAQSEPELFIAADGTRWISEALCEQYDHRAAILQYDGGLSREAANDAAWREIMTQEEVTIT